MRQKKFDRNKMIYNINNETYDLEKLKQYVFLVMKLETILLICTSQMMNKTI